MQALRPALPSWIFAALLSIGACNQPTSDGQKGVCKSDGESCTAASDCCSGFICQGSLCVFTGSQSGSAGNASGGNTSGGGNGTGGTTGSTGGQGSTGSTGGPGGTTGHPNTNGGSTSSGGGSTGGGFATAAHKTTQIPFQNGAVLANPVLVAITFQDDANASTMQQFDKFLVTSNWYSQVTPQFKIGAATEVDVPLTENSPASIDDSVIQTNIAALIQAGTAPGLAGGTVTLANAVYMIFYPSSTAITLQGQTVCTLSAGGYHSESTLTTGQAFAYAVVTNCVGALPVPAPQNIEWSASHEFIEAATDPFPNSNPGWQLSPQTNTDDPWSAVGGEVGDLCTGIFPQWSEGGYAAINRVWSDGSAAAGGDPCLPEPPGDPYFSTDLEPLSFVAVAAGSQTTFTVTGWSTGAVPDWQIFASPYEGSFTPGASLSAATLNNGQTATLTVTVPAGTPSGGQSYATVSVASGSSQNDFTSTIVGVYVP